MRIMARLSFCLVVAVASVTAQPLPRRATNIAALITYPGFYHQRPVTVAGRLERHSDGQLHLTDEVGSMRVVYQGAVTDGLYEVRGEYWDLGRMNADDPRLAALDLSAIFQIAPGGPWPRPGQATGIIAAAIQPTTPPVAPSVRAMVLHPARFLEQRVTVTGQFTGRNLLGDLPDAPANSQYDFVLRSADSAIWVSHVRPRGRDFELALDARVDTGRWLEVTGVLRQARGLQWLDATDTTVAIVKPPADPAPDESAVPVPAAPAPEAIFSAPTEDEIDVDPETTIRIQFSRDIAPATVKGQVQVSYIGPNGAAVGDPVTFSTAYRAANRVLEITLDAPLEGLRRVKVDLLDGILGTDDQPLVPWTLTFRTGA